MNIYLKYKNYKTIFYTHTLYVYDKQLKPVINIIKSYFWNCIFFNPLNICKILHLVYPRKFLKPLYIWEIKHIEIFIGYHNTIIIY